MATPVMMPRQGQSVETCILVSWTKKPGDKVTKGEILYSYETDKAAFDEAAPADGILLDVFFREGDEVPVLTNIAVIGEEGEPIDEFKPGADTADKKDEAPKTEKAETPDKPEPSAQQQEKAAPAPSDVTAGEIKASPRARKMAGEAGISLHGIQGSGPGGRIIERDLVEQYPDLHKLTRLAQKVSEEKGLYATEPGTGVGNRSLDTELSEAPQAPVESGDKMVPLSNIRKIIAQNMLASLQNSAQLTHHISADARKLLKLRKHFKAEYEHGGTYNVTINDLVCYAVIRALEAKPEINAHFLGDRMRYIKNVHLGIAVDTPRGLMVPTVRKANLLNIYGLSAELKDAAEACKTGKIDPELLKSESASFTISNLGAYGIEMFTPVLNLPQCGILGVNTITTRPGDAGDGIVGLIPYIGLSLTYDHRALDGAPASAFLKEVKDQIENLTINTESK